MQKTNFIVIEEQLEDANALLSLLNEMPQFNCLAVLHCTSEIKPFLEQHEIDLVFLEAELSNEVCIETAKYIVGLNIPIIVTAVSKNYAVDAFDIGVDDYIVKPLKKNRLSKAIAKSRRRNNSPNYSPTTDSEEISQNVFSKIVINNLQTIEVIDVEQMSRCEAKGPYTVFQLKSGKQVMATKPLKYYEPLLIYNGFFRIHRSHMVAIKEIQTIDKSNMTVKLGNGETLPVSPDRISKFVDQFKQIIDRINKASLQEKV